jgi:hypothetical protein
MSIERLRPINIVILWGYVQNPKQRYKESIKTEIFHAIRFISDYYKLPGGEEHGFLSLSQKTLYKPYVEKFMAIKVPDTNSLPDDWPISYFMLPCRTRMDLSSADLKTIGHIRRTESIMGAYRIGAKRDEAYKEFRQQFLTTPAVPMTDTLYDRMVRGERMTYGESLTMSKFHMTETSTYANRYGKILVDANILVTNTRYVLYQMFDEYFIFTARKNGEDIDIRVCKAEPNDYWQNIIKSINIHWQNI